MTKTDEIYAAIKDEGWYALADLAEATGMSEASVSARLRDLRKARYGSHHIQRKKIAGEPVYVYRLKDTPIDHMNTHDGLDEQGNLIPVCADCWAPYPCPTLAYEMQAVREDSNERAWAGVKVGA